jgi:hypothetical protein
VNPAPRLYNTKNTWTSTRSARRPDVIPLSGRAQPAEQELSLRRLLDLLAQDETDEDENQAGPSQFAFLTAYNLIQEAEKGACLPLRSSPVVDSEGGIRVTWRHQDRQVKLVCPAKRDGVLYLYWASKDGNGIRNENVTASTLTDRLSWLTKS